MNRKCMQKSYPCPTHKMHFYFLYFLRQEMVILFSKLTYIFLVEKVQKLQEVQGEGSKIQWPSFEHDCAPNDMNTILI